MNFAFYISGNAGTFRKILKSDSNIFKYTKIVISDSIKNIDLKPILHKKNIEYLYYEYNDLLSNNILESFLKNKIDFCFSFGHHILKGELINVYKNKIINFHPSILPLYPGNKSIDQALLDNKSILLGNTAHFIDKGIDTGPIIMQSISPKSLFKEKNYDLIIDLQLPMLDFIYKKLIKNKIKVKNNSVVIEGKQCESSFFYNI